MEVTASSGMEWMRNGRVSHQGTAEFNFYQRMLININFTSHLQTDRIIISIANNQNLQKVDVRKKKKKKTADGVYEDRGSSPAELC